MKVEQLTVPREKAIEEYEAYKEALKKPRYDHEQYLKDLKSIYGHMKHGRSIIDLWTSLTKAGLNKQGDPRLALCRADSKNVHFEKKEHGAGVFSRENGKPRNRWDRWKDDTKIPEGIFPPWPLKDPARTDYSGNRKRNEIETIVPIIPAKFLNALRGGLHNYHILWEVKEWKPTPPKDPILLKKLTPNIFVVLATWNLTKLERAVIQGRLG